MSIDPEGIGSVFAALVASPARSLVACDYDGTLSDIVEDPERAVPVAGAVEALTALAPHVGRLAVVTGRPAAAAVGLGGLDRVPGLVVMGLYGSQRWEGGRLSGPPPSPQVAQALAEVRSLLATGAGGPGAVGARVEDKGDSFAVHVRRAADPPAALAALRAPLADLADRSGLVVEPGRLVLELRPAGPDKGAALRMLAGELGPAPSAVLYAGDDLGDLSAFAAVRAMRAGGVPGWAVAVANHETPEVAARADIVVDGPPDCVLLLAGLAAAIGQRGGSASSASS
jgi:trehalose 6-phosphate phosphatase